MAAGPDYLEFLNSWGGTWANGGRFRVRDSEVLRDMVFYDVFWTENMLSAAEKREWKRHSKEVLDRVTQDYPSLRKVLDQP